MTANNKCLVCESGVDISGLSQLQAAKQVGCTRHQVRKHVRACVNTPESYPPFERSTPAAWSKNLELTGQHGTLCSGVLDTKISDYSDLLRIWNLDPAVFEVVEPVTFKAWDIGAKDSNDELISKTLYSYKANIRKISLRDYIPQDVVDDWTDSLLSLNEVEVRKAPDRVDSHYVVCIADAHLGQKDTDAVVDSWRSGFLVHLEAARMQCLNSIVIAFLGDEHNGVAGNYGTQAYESVLNLKDQMRLDFNLRMWTIGKALERGFKVQVISVPSNHCETRDGYKTVTSIYDNRSTLLSELVKDAFSGVELSHLVEWNIAEGTPYAKTEFEGKNLVFCHGHTAVGSGTTASSKFQSSIEKQIIGNQEYYSDVSVVVAGHYHTLSLIESCGRTFVTCPALANAKVSDYYIQKHGKWSSSGILGFKYDSCTGRLLNINVY